MDLRRIPIEDIYPDEKNPRKDFGDIKALAESFELNALDPGEPVNPIVVVQDGGIYRIVDGERRYKAMLKTKVAACNAVVCEDMDEANAQIAMLATNDKQPLTPIEVSRGVQQQLLLGVDPATIEKSARMKPGTASKVATARALVDDAAEDMTLDRMLAIEELADDPDAVESLTNCSERDWERVADNIRQERRNAERQKSIIEALDRAGIPFVEEIDEEYDRYVRRIDSATELENIIDNEDDHTFLQEGDQVQTGRYQATKAVYGIGAVVYMIPNKEDAEDIDPEEEARKQRLDELTKAVEQGSEDRIEWFASRLNELDRMPSIIELIEETIFKDDSSYGAFAQKISDFEKRVSREISKDMNEALAAYGYTQTAISVLSWRVRDMIENNIFDNRSFDYLCWIRAFQDDGFELNSGELELITIYEKYLEAAEEQEVTDGEDQ